MLVRAPVSVRLDRVDDLDDFVRAAELESCGRPVWPLAVPFMVPFGQVLLVLAFFARPLAWAAIFAVQARDVVTLGSWLLREC